MTTPTIDDRVISTAITMAIADVMKLVDEDYIEKAIVEKVIDDKINFYQDRINRGIAYDFDKSKPEWIVIIEILRNLKDEIGLGEKE